MISYGLNNISSYLGGWATAFLATMLFIAIIRIGFAFVLKIFRMNIDYRTTTSKLRTYQQHDNLNKKK